ncbi:MAG: hypothetical protein ACOCVM_03520 [Desulfovibrionaceae bacterium]
MKSAWILLAPALALMLAAGCGKRMTLDDVQGRCMASQAGGCMAASSICRAYVTVLDQQHDGPGDCRQSCEQVRRDNIHRQGLEGCAEVFERGQSVCNQYCNQQYVR